MFVPFIFRHYCTYRIHNFTTFKKLLRKPVKASTYLQEAKKQTTCSHIQRKTEVSRLISPLLYVFSAFAHQRSRVKISRARDNFLSCFSAPFVFKDKETNQELCYTYYILVDREKVID